MTAIIPVMGPVIGATTFSPAASPFGAGIDADALLWSDAVVANGGTVSANRLVVVSAFVAAEKASGAWALTDDYWGLWGENAPQALTSLKQRSLATVVNSPPFTVDRDYTFNGTTQYLNTGFIPSSHGINCTGGTMRIGTYERTDVDTATASANTLDSSTVNLSISNRIGANVRARINSAVTEVALTVADGRGLKTASRNGSGAVLQFYDRGVRLADGATSAVTTTPTRAIYIGAANSSGTPTTFRAVSMGFAVVGGPLSDAQEAAQYANVQAWATAVGAQV